MGRQTGSRIVGRAPGRVEIENFEIPVIGPLDLLVETECTLVSPGTERAFLLGLPNTPNSFPHYPGYSSVGKVVETGCDIKGFAIGDRVVTQAGHQSHAVVTGDEALLLKPNDIAAEQAVFFNLSAIALQGVRKSRLEIGEPTVVLGLGLVGLLATGLARIGGAFPLITLDPLEGRRNQSIRLGADASMDPRERGFESEIEAHLDGRSVAVVIEATGREEAVPLSFKIAGWHGRVVLLASTRGISNGVDFYSDVHKKGLSIIGAHNFVRPRDESSPGFWTARDDWKVALSLIAARRLEVEPLISHRVSWERSPSMYNRLLDWDPDLLGVVLEWNR